ncbi:HtaA domain-containing protein [Nocardiopsis sp. EMB25]|uniref:HtaA domain-containing protein n=1 Tax=Nocardiopsis sp. EMB25 TaxID=2835867 RepID=UPI002283F27E|nr:HtaA domain-containing protein [Nocardiopsis sp. EMB25]MCY9782324.1 HtaA domain-containing protein [Nocardiopsis sp. EMB25]
MSLTMAPHTSDRARRTLRGLATVASTAALGAVLALAPSTAMADAGLTGGSADWGVKESFRDYVTSFIAQGDYVGVDGATVNTGGTVDFPGAGGALATDGSFDASFSGGVVLTGHDYGNGSVLEVRVHDPRVEFDGTDAIVYARVVSRTFDGPLQTTPNPLVDYGEIAVTELTGESVTDTGTELTFDSTGGTLHADAVDAFAGFYSAGTAMDPISFTVETN